MKGKPKHRDGIVCTRCNEVLDPKTAVVLELSQTDGNYYDPERFPKDHISQGGFDFGLRCSRNELRTTDLNLISKFITHGN